MPSNFRPCRFRSDESGRIEAKHCGQVRTLLVNVHNRGTGNEQFGQQDRLVTSVFYPLLVIGVG